MLGEILDWRWASAARSPRAFAMCARVLPLSWALPKAMLRWLAPLRFESSIQPKKGCWKFPFFVGVGEVKVFPCVVMETGVGLSCGVKCTILDLEGLIFILKE